MDGSCVCTDRRSLCDVTVSHNDFVLDIRL